MSIRPLSVYLRALIPALAVFALIGCHPTVATVASATDLTPCRLAGAASEVKCGQIALKGLAGAPLTIHFAIAPAQARRPMGDPVFIVAGGPGQAATDLAGVVLPLMSRLNRFRDIVFVDQRGTGASSPLRCESPALGDMPDVERLKKTVHDCYAQMQKLGLFADDFLTEHAVADYEAVREHIGYAKINLWAGSYGTRVALEYARQHPDRVRSMVLDGVAPADVALPASFAQDTDQALSAMINDCMADPTCHADHAFLATHVDTLLSAARSSKESIDLPDPVSGTFKEAVLDLPTMAAWLRTPLYSTLTASLLPVAIDRAVEGDFSTFAALAASGAGEAAEGVSLGMHLSILCGEDFPRITAQDMSAMKSSRFGTVFYDQYQALCSQWPVKPASPSFFSPVQSAAPTLILSGGLDPATPPWHGDRVAKALSHAVHLTAPRLGHGVSFQGCGPDLLFRFIDDPSSVTVRDGACLQSIPRPPFYRRMEAPTRPT